MAAASHHRTSTFVILTTDTGCAIRRNGGVGCWSTRERPVSVVPDLEQATYLAAVSERVCAVANGGSVFCWNMEGFDAKKPDWASPRRKPLRIQGLTRVKQVEVGDSMRSGRPDEDGRWKAWGGIHQCARQDDGSLWCWGDNLFAQTGRATPERVAAPVRVEGLGLVTDFSTAGSNTCAVAGGRAWCWGEYGIARPEDPKCDEALPRRADLLVNCTPKPRMVPGLDAVIQVAVGGNLSQGNVHACALSGDGRIACWGRNHCGQCGADPGRVGTIVRPDEPIRVSSLENAVELSLSSFLSCALTGEGAVFCWGCDTNCCDRSEFDTRGARLSPTRIVGIDSATEVHAQAWGGCARLRDRRVVCWGDPKGGRIGDGVKPLELDALSGAAE
jgi:serine/threonine-protein kinase